MTAKHFESQSEMLFAIPGARDRLMPLARDLAAAQERMDRATAAVGTAQGRIARLQADIKQAQERAEQRAADAQRARLAQLLAGNAPAPANIKAGADVTALSADIELLEGAVPGLESSVESERLTWSLAWQAFRRETYALLDAELQARASALRELAAVCHGVLSGHCGSGLHLDFSVREAAPCAEPNATALLKPPSRLFRERDGDRLGAFSIDVIVPHDIGDWGDPKAWLHELARIVLKGSEQKAGARGTALEQMLDPG